MFVGENIRNLVYQLMVKLVCLINVVILDSIFSFKSSYTVIMNYVFEFNSITAILDNNI